MIAMNLSFPTDQKLKFSLVSLIQEWNQLKHQINVTYLTYDIFIFESHRNKIPISDSDLSESFSEPILNSNFENNRESSSQIFEFSYVQKIGPFLIVNLAFFWSYLTGQIEDQL